MYGGRSTGLRWVGNTALLTHRPLIVLVTAAFIVQPDSCVWLMPDNRMRARFHRITGDAVDPEFGMGASHAGWLSNRMKLLFKKVSQ
jgi:hypothetical protein